MWTAELTVGFVPLPSDQEEAYWEAILYFGEVIFAEFNTQPALSQIEGRDLEEVEETGSSDALLE